MRHASRRRPRCSRAARPSADRCRAPAPAGRRAAACRRRASRSRACGSTRGRRREGERHAVGGDLVVVELLRLSSRKPGDDAVAERAGGEGRLASTSVTVMRGSSRFSARAQVAPAKPPPTTTTRPPAPARAPASAAAQRRPQRAVLQECRGGCDASCWSCGVPQSFCARVPGGDRLDLVVGEALGDAVHDGRRPLARCGRPPSRCDDLAPDRGRSRRGTGVSTPARGRMTAGAGGSARRGHRPPVAAPADAASTAVAKTRDEWPRARTSMAGSSRN